MESESVLPTTVKGMHALYTSVGLVTFGVQLSKYWHVKKEVWKKDVLPPNGFQDFKIDTIPSLRAYDNALGMLCGTPNGIFVLDIDDPEALDALLIICGKSPKDLPNDVPIQQSPRGLHMVFAYDDRLNNINGRSCVIRDHPRLPIDTRTTGNFIYVAPSAYKDSDVDWHYHWRNDLYPFRDGKAPPLMPEWLYDQIIKENEKTTRMKAPTKVICKRPTLKDQYLQNKTPSATKGASFSMRYNQYLSAANDIFKPKNFQTRELKTAKHSNLQKVAARV